MSGGERRTPCYIQVGGVRFGKGVRLQLVLDAIERQFEYAALPRMSPQKVERLRRVLSAKPAGKGAKPKVLGVSL